MTINKASSYAKRLLDPLNLTGKDSVFQRRAGDIAKSFKSKPKLKPRPGPKKKTSKDTKKVIHAKRKKAKSPHKYNPSGHRTVVGPNPDSKEAAANRKFADKLKKIKVNPKRKK